MNIWTLSFVVIFGFLEIANVQAQYAHVVAHVEDEVILQNAMELLCVDPAPPNIYRLSVCEMDIGFWCATV